MRILRNKDHEETTRIDLPVVDDEHDHEILYMTKTRDNLRIGICMGYQYKKMQIHIENILVYGRRSLH